MEAQGFLALRQSFLVEGPIIVLPYSPLSASDLLVLLAIFHVQVVSTSGSISLLE